MAGHDGWQLIGKPLGRGGQGTVYRARSPQSGQQLTEYATAIKHLIREMTAGVQQQKSVDEMVPHVQELAYKIVQVGGPNPVEGLGALKLFAIPPDNEIEEKHRLSAGLNQR